MNDLNDTTAGDFIESENCSVVQNVVYISIPKEPDSILTAPPILPSTSNTFSEMSELFLSNEIPETQSLDAISYEIGDSDPVANLLRSWNLFEDLYDFLKCKFHDTVNFLVISLFVSYSKRVDHGRTKVHEGETPRRNFLRNQNKRENHI